MADKDWDEMSLAEKCDSLNASRERLFTIASNLATEMRQMQMQFGSKLNEVAAAVEKLEARIAGSGDR
jgi:hypothetical protein